MKMFEWEQDDGVELTIPSINGDGLDVPDLNANENVLRLARAEALAAEGKAGIARLRKIAAAMAIQTNDAPPITFTLDDLDEPSYQLVCEVLGHGEVSGQVSELQPLIIQESIFPGLWRIKSPDFADAREILILADVPPMLHARATDAMDEDMTIPQNVQDTMNAMPVLAEIRDRSLAYQAEHTNHIINFTLLPMSEQDMALLRDTLGAGHIDLISTGYGACRVCSTRWPHVWSVQYFNSMEKIILDTLEIGAIPAAVRASQEDFQDSAERILEIIEAYL